MSCVYAYPMYQINSGSVVGTSNAACAFYDPYLFYNPSAVCSEEDTAGNLHELFKTRAG